jgi:hypothetical protein
MRIRPMRNAQKDANDTLEIEVHQLRCRDLFGADSALHVRNGRLFEMETGIGCKSSCGVKSEATPMPNIAKQRLRGSITFPPGTCLVSP